MLLDYYKSSLDSLGMIYDDDGYIYAPGRSKPILVLEEDLPLCLPTKEAIDTMLEDTGTEIKVLRKIYNPIDENVVKGDNRTLVRTKTFVEGRLGYAILALGSLLLTIAKNTELQKKVHSLEINTFLASLADVKKQNMKEIVDAKCIDTWKDIHHNYASKDKNFVDIFLKKSATYQGTKYNRLATFVHNIYNEIIEANGAPIAGLKLRPKDYEIYRKVLEFILSDMDDNKVISIGSTDTYSPAYIALMTMYVRLMNRFNTLNRLLVDVDPEMADLGYTEITISEDDINGVQMYAAEVKAIPNAMDIERRIKTAHIEPQTVAIQQQPQQVVGAPQVHQAQTPLPYTAPSSEEGSEEKLLSALRGGRVVGPAPVMPMQPMMPQQLAPMQMPVVPGPMSGYNPGMGMQMYQQPGMIQQPGFYQQQPAFNPFLR